MITSIILITGLWIKFDEASGLSMHRITSGRGHIWGYYLERLSDSFYFGLGDSKSTLIKNIPYDYDRSVSVADAIKAGGSHSLFINTIVTRGTVGLGMLLLYVYIVFVRRIKQLPELNIAMILFTLPNLMFTAAQSFGGLGLDVVILMLAMLVPYQSYIPSTNMKLDFMLRKSPKLKCAE